MTIWRVVLIVCLVWIGVLGPVFAQPDVARLCTVTAGEKNVRVRNGPGVEQYGMIGLLYSGETVPAIGRSRALDWYAVEYVNAAGQREPRAWVAANAVIAGGACDDLPTLPDPGPPEEVVRLMAVPVLPEALGARIPAIFAQGQALGNDPHAFTKVGDCNTAIAYFLTAFDRGTYDLGPYSALDPTIAFFDGWFAHDSLAGQVGLNAAMMLDPLFADPEVCRAADGEGLLACEYRRTRPAVAVMMFGLNDLYNLTEDQFAAALTQIVELSLAEGVIPVLTTFTWHHDDLWQSMLRYNVITLEIAQAYDLPLINFWRAAQELPDSGLVVGYTHLTDNGSDVTAPEIRFTGEESVVGYTLRNLLTLQTLDLLRREVLSGEETAASP